MDGQRVKLRLVVTAAGVLCAEPILQFLLLSLQQSPLATAAADALQCVCSQCPDQMTAHFDSLVRIVTDVNSFDVSNDAAIGLLKGSIGLANLARSAVLPTGLYILLVLIFSYFFFFFFIFNDFSETNYLRIR